MDRKEMKRPKVDEVTQKFHDTELAFEYEMGVEYQKRLMHRHEQLKKSRNEKNPHQK